MILPDRPLTLAAAAYPIEWHARWEALSDKLDQWVRAAARDGADIAVLPEYAGLEAAFVGARRHARAAAWCAAAAAVAARYVGLCASLAQRHHLMLLAGSLPALTGDGRLVNRAWLCAPNGGVTAHDKQILTPWERAHTPLVAGTPLRARPLQEGRVGVLICYDSEFPPLAEALGSDILLVPSCTEAPAGQARVRLAARARALEGQAVSVHAPLIGAIPECEIVDANTGAAGIYGPPDHGFPDDGILARGVPDTPGWVIATLPEGALSTTRATGAVAPRAHMAEACRRGRAAASLPGCSGRAGS